MFTKITADELKKKMDRKDDFKLVDVLLSEKYDEWHIPGAVNIPTDELSKRAPEELDPDEEIILYCLGFECKASTRAAGILVEMGYKKVVDFKGGREEWQSKEYPVEK